MRRCLPLMMDHMFLTFKPCLKVLMNIGQANLIKHAEQLYQSDQELAEDKNNIPVIFDHIPELFEKLEQQQPMVCLTLMMPHTLHAICLSNHA